MRNKLCLILLCSLGFVFVADGSEGMGFIDIPDQVVFGDKRLKMLLDGIDLSLPELAKVRAASDEGDWDAVKAALAQYLRERTVKSWRIDPHNIDRTVAYKEDVAEKAREGLVLGGLVKVWKQFPGNDIDWFHNETQNRNDLAFNPEWQWQLNRMGFWHDMGRAYNLTGDERYAKAWATQLRTFVLHCPVPPNVDNSVGSAWRTIEAGIRMSSAWPESFHRFLLSPSVSDADLLLYMSSALEHGRYLRQFASRNNWLTMEMNGLYSVGSVFPEFKEADEWRAYAVNRIYAETKTQFLEDGSQVELTPGYHNVALDNMSSIVQLANSLGRSSEVPQDYIAQLERAHDFNLLLMTPDRSAPTFNDSWPFRVQRVLARGLIFFPHRQDYLWIVTEGEEGKEPEVTSLPLWNAGYFVMRSGWGRDANFSVLDAGPLGVAHVHQDKLNLVIWAYGRELLFDGGGGSYERSKWREYAIDGYSHNIVIVDGMSQRRERWGKADTDYHRISREKLEDVIWESDAERDFVVGVYDEAFGKGLDERSYLVRHTRRVLFEKPDMWVVVDTLEPKDEKSHHYQARWHLLSTETKLDDESMVVQTADAELPNLAIIPLDTYGLQVETAVGQEEPELLGWYVRKDMIEGLLPATTVLHNREGTGTQRFATLFVPIRPGEKNPVVKVTAQGENTWLVEFDDGTYRLIHIEAEADAPISVRFVQ